MRLWGTPPYTAALIHGGPGAAGEMQPVARALAASFGIVEPLQTRNSVDAQIHELERDLALHTAGPITLIGFSWGAWLAGIFAARHPERVKKVIMIAAGSFEEHYAADIDDLRISRLSPALREEVLELLNLLPACPADTKQSTFGRLGELLNQADTFEAVEDSPEDDIDLRPDIFESVWPEAAVMRASGELLTIMRNIRCPVLAIHGDHDSHRAEGVRIPLSAALGDFRFELLKKCGHKPWIERHAQDRFYMVLRKELAEG